MDPITLNLRVGREPPASAPGPGEMSAEEIDANFAALRTAADQLDAEKLSVGAVNTRPVVIGFAGDSIAGYWSRQNGDSPITWAIAEHYPCSILRGFSSALGGSSSSHIITTQIAQLEALSVKPDVMVLQTFQNDGISTEAIADTFYAYGVEYVNRALAAGVKQVWVCSRPPKASVTVGDAYSIAYLNRRLRMFCEATQGAVYIDTFNLWRNMNLATATTEITFKGTPNGIDSYSDDGVHPTPLAMRELKTIVSDLLRKIALPITPFEANLEAYNNTSRIWANFIGPNGYMLGTSGQLNGVDNAGVAGTGTTTQTRWQITAANGVTVTPSIVTGSDGYLYQQIVFGGTATANTTVSVSCVPAFNVVAGTFVTEAIIEMQGVSGVRSVLWRNNQWAVGFDSSLTTQAQMPDNYDARLHFRSEPYPLTVTNFSGNNHQMQVSVRNGVSPTGTIRLGRCGTYRVA
jgi:hypothetical protein